MPEGHKGSAAGEPMIRPIGPYVRSHPRHFRQQSDYTICGGCDRDSGWRFCPHESVFGSRGDEQDALWKFNLPSSEGTKILDSLNQYNLNAFSLFDSEETLLETMWFREHVLPLSVEPKQTNTSRICASGSDDREFEPSASRCEGGALPAWVAPRRAIGCATRV
jgi:hypothetical protein